MAPPNSVRVLAPTGPDAKLKQDRSGFRQGQVAVRHAGDGIAATWAVEADWLDPAVMARIDAAIAV